MQGLGMFVEVKDPDDKVQNKTKHLIPVYLLSQGKG